MKWTATHHTDFDALFEPGHKGATPPMQNITQTQWTKALEQVIKRAEQEPAFRELCLKEPRKALQEYVPTELPENFKVDFIDGRGSDMTVVLPPLAQNADELSSEELEQVAGGVACLLSCGTSCIATCLCISVPTITGI